ncbi:MAG TPA: hypothetical protein VHO03_20745 [Ignavibacteriales bacterium]|nr:hypothetical protein [Ignavibacteriales bacterium]
MKFSVILVSFILAAAAAVNLRAQAGVAAVTFLELPASAEMYGMGYTSVAVASEDPMYPYYNPAQLGMQSFQNNLSIGFNSSNWLENYFPGIKVSTFAANTGIDLRRFIKGIPHLSLGFGYSRLKIDFGKDNFYLPNNSESYDKTDNFTLSAALDYYLKASLGFTYKHVYSKLGVERDLEGRIRELSAKTNLYDWGVFLEVPVFPILEQTTARHIKIYNSISPVFDLTFGFSKSNLGQDSINYSFPEQGDPLPRVARTGIGLLAGFSYEAEGITLMPIKAKWSIESNDLLVKPKDPHGWEYQPGFGDINFFKEVILGKTNFETEKLKGWELNFLETISLYGGRFEEDMEMGNRHFNSNGWSIRTQGLVKVLRIISPEMFGSNALTYALSHLDFRYSISQTKTDNPSAPLNNVKFSTFNIMFNGF